MKKRLRLVSDLTFDAINISQHHREGVKDQSKGPFLVV